MTGYLRFRRRDRGALAQLLTTGVSPECLYRLEPGLSPVVKTGSFYAAATKLFPQTEPFTLIGYFPTVAVRINNIWAFRNGDNRSSSNFLIYDDTHKSFHSRTNLFEVIEFIQILHVDRHELPLLMGKVFPKNQPVFEQRLKGALG
jgi:hypothetical protein